MGLSRFSFILLTFKVRPPPLELSTGTGSPRSPRGMNPAYIVFIFIAIGFHHLLILLVSCF